MYLVLLDLNKKIWGVKNFLSLLYLGCEWNFGFVLVILCFFQILTGVLLSLYLTLGLNTCLYSKSFIIKEIEMGWGISYLHMLLPSFIFLFLFFHILKSLMYSIYIYLDIWISGFIILFLFIVISFTGYGLVFGSLGFWAIVVVIGIVEFLFGGLVSFLFFSDFGCLSDLIVFKVFTYHFLLSLFVIVFICFHIYFTHVGGSSIGVFTGFIDYYSFSSFLFIKDLLILSVVLVVCSLCFCFSVEWFFSLDNFIELDVFKVPEEINSEWYLRLVFILLRSVDSKGIGIIYIFLILGVVLLRVWVKSIFGEVLFNVGIFYYLVFLIWLLIVFTLSSFGGSLFVTSGVLFTLSFVFDYACVEIFCGYGCVLFYFNENEK